MYPLRAWRMLLLAVLLQVHHGSVVFGQADGGRNPTPVPTRGPNGEYPDFDDMPGFDLLPTDTTKGSIYKQDGYVRVDFPMKNFTKYRDEAVKISCEITGDPLPRYKWYKDDIVISENDRKFKIKRTNWGSRISIGSLRPEDSGNYTCMGYNRFGQATSTGELIVRNEPNPNAERTLAIDPFPKGLPGSDHYSRTSDNDDRRTPGYNSAGFCQPYRGATCSKFVGNKSIFVTSRTMQNSNEQRFIAAFTIMSKLSKSCHEYAIPSLCYHAFPLCDDQGEQQRPRKICKEECEFLENKICREDYIRAREYPLIVNQLVLPNCAELPEPGTVAAQNCIRLGIPGVPRGGYSGSSGGGARYSPGQDTGGKQMKNCYNGTGEHYKGTVNRTKSGYLCQPWTKNLPAELFKQSAAYRALVGHNYCRNPGNVEEGPWCFTTNKDVQKELCNIPVCEDPTPAGNSDINRLVYILVPGITVPLVYLILIAALCCFCRRKNNKKAQNLPHHPDQQMELSPLTGKSGSRIKEIPLQQIRFVQELGEGTYGKVYRGEALGLQPGNAPVRVTIKTLKETSSPKVQNDFRREVDLMTELRHPSVVCLLGVCMKQQPMCMLFEYLPHGDLHEFLNRYSPHSDLSVSDDEGHQRVLEYTEMLHISTHVAAGMEYLSCQRYIHRDLAARNILVGDNLTVKISNFGISKDLYSSDYYRAQNKSLIPVRWMSPEGILYAKFTTESDVWSFGVLLWEIFSYGVQPYFGYSNQEVIEMVKNRQILPCPEDCPGRVYALMVDCWHEIPTRRPTFTEVHNKLRTWKGEAMVPNPHWSTCLSQSHSGHSSSTQHSSHSQPSRHSCSGPSTGNNTATTGLTAVSNNSDPMHYQPRPPPPAPAPYMQPIPLQTFGHPMPMAPMPTYSNNYRPPPQYNSVNPYLQAKVSPPGSVASHQSNSSGSHSSGEHFHRPGHVTAPNQVALPPNPIYNNNMNSMPAPASCAMAVNQADSGKFSNMLMQNTTYIPEGRTSEM
ncbi:inactive tyrosine-protein kinase transmembrane receptor ROR1-like isoform X2 [Liolophura sinensis]|uniref:inactive tyrosine-protein kinase transmembrane receptor ROR1-like isoform X2 n=1 Tax=Liolophura sinensis TaxID=3198878 RepID=UPI00315935E0